MGKGKCDGEELVNLITGLVNDHQQRHFSNI
jgi:hypothetical protein